jgi:hypothetical protein
MLMLAFLMQLGVRSLSLGEAPYHSNGFNVCFTLGGPVSECVGWEGPYVCRWSRCRHVNMLVWQYGIKLSTAFCVAVRFWPWEVLKFPVK